VIAVSIAFPVKAYNARKHSQVSMLFSDPTGSGLTDPPAVLVQGDAAVAEVLAWVYRTNRYRYYVEQNRA